MTRPRTLVLLAAIFLCANARAYPCTTFTINDDGHVVYGRNLDWWVGSGLIMVNHRNIAKRALVVPLGWREGNPASWVSRYGSVTFNGLAREFPTGGINEAGLVVDVMWLGETRYPAPDDRCELYVLQWTQYVLDTCATVDEAIAADAKVRISQDCPIPQHFLISDRTGKTAVIEFLKGKQVVHVGDSLPHACLTNDTYATSIRFARQCKGLGGERPVHRDRGSLSRFVRAAQGVKQCPAQEKDRIAHAFDILHNVSAGYEPNHHCTVWSIAYDITDMKIHFRTHLNRETRTIDLGSLDFTNKGPVQVWDVQNPWKGDITAKSKPYTAAANREIIVKHITHPAIKRKFGDFSPVIGPLTGYPEKLTREE